MDFTDWTFASARIALRERQRDKTPQGEKVAKLSRNPEKSANSGDLLHVS